MRKDLHRHLGGVARRVRHAHQGPTPTVREPSKDCVPDTAPLLRRTPSSLAPAVSRIGAPGAVVAID
eukprot:7079794-Alexandrium_andersonii.AAC.1